MKNTYSIILLMALLIAPLLLNSGCTTYPTAAEVGAARGAAAGAVVGQAIGRNTKSTMIGVGVGALGGAVLNDQREKRRGY